MSTSCGAAFGLCPALASAVSVFFEKIPICKKYSPPPRIIAEKLVAAARKARRDVLREEESDVRSESNIAAANLYIGSTAQRGYWIADPVSRIFLNNPALN
jgi:hypothetical protein